MALLAALALTLCPVGPRDNCVVDGDTVWLGGEKIRLADIDAPEMDGRCDYERRLAIRARDRLLVLLNAGPVSILRDGVDRYGRTLAVLSVRGRSVGNQLVGEGLAWRWDGARRPWCQKSPIENHLGERVW